MTFSFITTSTNNIDVLLYVEKDVFKCLLCPVTRCLTLIKKIKYQINTKLLLFNLKISHLFNSTLPLNLQ